MKDASVITKEEEYLKDLAYVSFTPIFILGVHRSGTSILYKMLVATGCFNPVTAYHLINYDELLSNHHEQKEAIVKQQLTDTLRKDGSFDRGIDRLKVTADFAEEYGFLLGRLTMKMAITKKSVPLFTDLCKKIQFIAGNNKPLLLKNPYDFPNFLYIKELFPTAKFVFIHRHPLKTISSTLNAVRTILKKKNPYTSQLSTLYDTFYSNPLIRSFLRFLFWVIPECSVMFITRITAVGARYYVENIERLPVEDYISITYEDLCTHPQELLDTILSKFSFSPQHKIDAASFIKPRSVAVDDAVQKLRGHIYASMKMYCARFGYIRDG
ncbi:MAG: sulfotransferase [Candidatus Thermoplasmatota archaeon]|nr:sulfotransferase [Candidatus Thermoplasmatota archaeon]